MKITTKHGEIIAFNILTATLGYSRLHIFIYSRSKTTEDFIRCVIDALQILGGAPRHILTDNMSAVVSITNGTRYKHQKIRSFEKDTNIRIKLCKPKHPETKGKDESSNRFLSWLYAYDGEIENEKELIELIGKINLKVNDEINQTTKLPPIVLFQKEKEYLNPLPNRILLEDYVEDVETKTVPPTLLVSYKGSGYSVPKEFIGKRVKLVPCDNKLYIYSNTKLVTVHDITSRRFNYQTDDYVSALKTSIHNKDIDIEKIAEENLRLLEEII